MVSMGRKELNYKKNSGQSQAREGAFKAREGLFKDKVGEQLVFIFGKGLFGQGPFHGSFHPNR